MKPVEEYHNAWVNNRDTYLNEKLKANFEKLAPIRDASAKIGSAIAEYKKKYDNTIIDNIIKPMNDYSDEIGKTKQENLTALGERFTLISCLLHPECCGRPKDQCQPYEYL